MARCHFLVNILVEASEIGSISYKAPTERPEFTQLLLEDPRTSFPRMRVLLTNPAGSVSALSVTVIYPHWQMSVPTEGDRRLLLQIGFAVSQGITLGAFPKFYSASCHPGTDRKGENGNKRKKRKKKENSSF